MSVNHIIYKDGAKYACPITSEKTYRQLRGSEYQRDCLRQARRGDEQAKRRLVQFNYSLAPSGQDGQMFPLKGATTVGNSVGMDIDHLTAEELKATIEKVLRMKDELGLLMMERSARGEGLHIVFRRHPEMTNEENLLWASNLLGVEFDKGAKDITRVFFATSDSEEDLLFLDEELFESRPVQPLSPALPPSANARGKGAEKLPESPTPLPLGEAGMGKGSGKGAEAGSEALPSSLSAFSLCVQQAGLAADQMDVWGEHNWHTNLMAVLSVGLPKLMSRAQLEAVIAAKLPNYSQTEDCRKLIDYFYDNYSADKGFMSTALREINAKAQALPQPSHKGEGDEQEADAVYDELTRGWAPPALPRKIPRLMNLLTGNYDPRFREVLLLSALPVLSAHASHFRAQYLNGKIIGPQQYVAVIGGSGQGKGNCTDLYREMVQYTLQDNDEREWQKVKENAELRDKKANAKERPPKYHPRLRLFETTSKSSILELQTNLGRNGMLLGQFSEVDGLTNATRTAYSDISVLLRKGWDGDMHRQFYMSDSTCNTYTQMNISLLMAGTVRAMLERMFSDANCEGGLMQRCIPVLLPKTQRTFRPPRQNFLTEDEKNERDSLLISLYQKDLCLGDETMLLETPMMNRSIGQWFDELEERYNDGLMTEAEADLSHRCGEFMLRAAIPLVALYGQETREIVDFCRWVGETAHYAMCRIFGSRVQKDLTAAQELLAMKLDARKTAEPLLARLPEVFTIQQLKDLRQSVGQSSDVKSLLTRYCKNGKLERVDKGVYKKRGS